MVLGVSHKFRASGRGTAAAASDFGPGANGAAPFDVLFVDEAWQLPLHRFTGRRGLAPVASASGDVGQLPADRPQPEPLARRPGLQPLPRLAHGVRGRREDLRRRPARGVATDRASSCRCGGPSTATGTGWTAWPRPATGRIELPAMTGPAADVWTAVATGQPDPARGRRPRRTPEAPDIDQPLLDVVEELLAPLLERRLHDRRAALRRRRRARWTSERVHSAEPHGDPLIVVLATRNQAVDDATAMVERLIEDARPARRRPPRVDRRLLAGPDQPASPSPSTRCPAPTGSTSSTPRSAGSPSRAPEPPTGC